MHENVQFQRRFFFKLFLAASLPDAHTGDGLRCPSPIPTPHSGPWAPPWSERVVPERFLGKLYQVRQ